MGCIIPNQKPPLQSIHDNKVDQIRDKSNETVALEQIQVCNKFLNQMPPKKHQGDQTNLNQKELFEVLRKDENQIDEEGFGKLLQLLQVSEESPITYYLLTVCMGTPKMGHIGPEHIQRLYTYCKKAKSLDAVRKYLPKLQEQMKKEQNYHKMYVQTFKIYLGNQTTLKFEYGQILWKIMLYDRFRYAKEFETFLQSLGDKKPPKINKDLWQMMYHFVKNIRDIEKDYSDQDAWPVLFDSFVEFVKAGIK